MQFGVWLIFFRENVPDPVLRFLLNRNRFIFLGTGGSLTGSGVYVII